METNRRFRWVHVYFGRDWMRYRGWRLDLGFIVRPDLMTRADEGRLVLAGIWIEVTRWGAWLRSDADEIATRLLTATKAEQPTS